MRKMFLGLFLVLLGLSGIAWAQEPGSLSLLDMVSKPGDKVEIIVSILDKEGHPIKGLSQANFSVAVEGQEIKDFTVEPASSTTSPLSVLLAIDVSGSMKGLPITEAKKAAGIFLDQLEKEDFVSLMAFGSNVRRLTNFTKKRHEVREQLDRIKAEEKWTWLYQATYEALDYAAKAPTSRAVVVLLTDGKDEGSPRTEAEVLGRIKGTQIPIYALGFGAQAQVDYLKRIAGASGGSFQFTPTPEELVKLYNQVINQLKNQYLIRFTFDRPAGLYRGVVKLNFRGQVLSAKRKFLHVRAEPSVPEPSPPPPPPAPPPPPPKWYEQLPLPWVLIALTALALLLVAVVWLHFRRQRVAPATEESRSPQVSFMRDGKLHPLTTEEGKGSVNKGAKDTQILTSPGEVALRLDVQPLPIFFALIDSENERNYQEIIITRYDPEIKERYFKDRLYLLLPDKTISRPDKDRAGHAVIFFDQDIQRYKIQDLGSLSGTKLNDVTITDKVTLRNGDVIRVGGTFMVFYDKRIFTEST